MHNTKLTHKSGKEKNVKYKLKRDIIFSAGTIFEYVPASTRNDFFETKISMGDDAIGIFIIDDISQAEQFVEKI